LKSSATNSGNGYNVYHQPHSILIDEELRSVNLQTYKLSLWQLAKIFCNREHILHSHPEVGQDLGVAPASKTAQTVSSVKSSRSTCRYSSEQYSNVYCMILRMPCPVLSCSLIGASTPPSDKESPHVVLMHNHCQSDLSDSYGDPRS
jgi:hypothetical protein